MSRKKKSLTRPVEFSLEAPEREQVFLAGTFNDWDPDSLPMTRNDDGCWSVSLELPPGEYEYKFVADGEWCCEPEAGAAPFECECVENSFGTRNLRVHVSGE